MNDRTLSYAKTTILQSKHFNSTLIDHGFGGMNSKQWLLSAFNAREFTLNQCQQVHSNRCLIIDGHPPKEIATTVADAMVTRQKNAVLCIKTADCVPIVFHAPHHKVIAVAHAGWKGALAGIIQTTLVTMLDLGVDNLGTIQAAIGPCIHQANYQVAINSSLKIPKLKNIFNNTPIPPINFFLI